MTLNKSNNSLQFAKTLNIRDPIITNPSQLFPNSNSNHNSCQNSSSVFFHPIQHRVKTFKRLITQPVPRSFPSIHSTPSNFITSRNFLRSGRSTSTQFHVESFSLLPRLARYNATRHGEVRFTATITRIRLWYLRESSKAGAERIVHRCALVIPEPGFTWPGDLLTLHVKYVGARPRTTKMREGMIYNGVMGSRDDTAVIVAPRGIIAMPDLGLPSRDLGIGVSSRKVHLDCAMEKWYALRRGCLVKWNW